MTSRNGNLGFHLAFAAAMPLLLGAGLPASAWANPILYIVTQNNINGTNPTSDTNTLVSVDLGAPLVGGIFTATAIGPTTLVGAGGQTAEIRGLAYDDIDGMMYGITAQGILVTVNLNTGAATPVLTLPYYPQGSIQNGWSGLAFDGTQNLYVVNANGAQELVRINLGSAPPAPALVGSVNYAGISLQILGLALSNGVLYGSDRSNDTLVTINTATAAAAFTYGNAAVLSNVQEIAFGPTGTLYVIFDHVSTSDNAGLATFSFPPPSLTATQIGELPFQIDFNGCAGCGNSTYGAGGLAFGPEGYVEVCKSSSTTNPVSPTGIYKFTVSGSAFSSSANPLMVPVGECSGPIPVAPATATITELPAPGVGVSAITASGYSAPPNSQEQNRLQSYNLQTGTATVLVVPPPTAGDTSTETLATFTNYTEASFILSASPVSVSVAQGSSGTSTITSSVTGGFDAAIALTASGQPTGVTVSFSPTSITGAGTSTMTMTVAASTVPGTYSIMVTGTSGSITETTSVSLTVTATGIGAVTLFGFNGTDGEHPYGGLVQTTNGDLYGTTEGGGTNGYGTVFKITTSGALTTLHSFAGPDGTGPVVPLVQDIDGDLYGTTESGGANSKGTVFKMTLSGTLTTLHSFCSQAGCADGATPYAGLVQGTNGEFYGTTASGGEANCTDGCGTILKISPGGTLTTLHTFEGADGADPYAGLVQGTNGEFYGTTVFGGGANCTDGCGTIFVISPGGALTTLYNFEGAEDGANPYAGIVQAINGDFYGATFAGGANGGGTVFKITPGGTLTTLYNFCLQSGCPDGSGPYAGLVQATNGDFYGTTEYGGASNVGTVFEITPSGGPTTLYSFCSESGCADGADPLAVLIQDTNGSFYGTTYNGGPPECAGGCGTVFSLSAGLGPFVKTLPTFGKVGAAVDILGTNLTGATSVTFNGTAAVFAVNSSGTAISTAVPVGATSGAVQVVTPGGTLSSNVLFRVLP